MIVVKGEPVASLPKDLTFLQRFEAFCKFSSTKVLALLLTIYGFWEFINAFMPTLVTELFAEYPLLAKLRLPIYMAIGMIAFYKSRMRTEVIEVKPTKPSVDDILSPPIPINPTEEKP